MPIKYEGSLIAYAVSLLSQNGNKLCYFSDNSLTYFKIFVILVLGSSKRKYIRNARIIMSGRGIRNMPQGDIWSTISAISNTYKEKNQ